MDNPAIKRKHMAKDKTRENPADLSASTYKGSRTLPTSLSSSFTKFRAGPPVGLAAAVGVGRVKACAAKVHRFSSVKIAFAVHCDFSGYSTGAVWTRIKLDCTRAHGAVACTIVNGTSNYKATFTFATTHMATHTVLAIVVAVVPAAF